MTRRIILWLIAITILTSCSPGSGSGETANTGEVGLEIGNTPISDRETSLDFDGFVIALQAEGAEATAAGSFTSTALTGNERLVRVNGEDIQVYEYADAALAAQEASTINRDGGGFEMPDPDNPGLTIASLVDWIATPHFYRNGRLIVQYIGDNQEIIALLEKVLGPQVAGGVSESKPSLMVDQIEPAEGAPMSFEEAAHQATSVVLAQVTNVIQGPDYIGNVEIPLCRPSQLVTVKILKVFKGPLLANQTHTIYQEAGDTDLDTGCGNNPAAEKVIMIMAHDPLYEMGQRYLLALSPFSSSFDPDPAIQAANLEIVSVIEKLAPDQVLFNGRLYVEQGGHAQLEQADVVTVAYDDYGRAIPGQPMGYSLADYEALLVDGLGDAANQLSATDVPSAIQTPTTPIPSISADWPIYQNEFYAHQLTYPPEAQIHNLGVDNVSAEWLPANMTADEYLTLLQETYPDNVCLNILYQQGFVAILAPRDNGGQFIGICSFSGLGAFDLIEQEEELRIDGQAYTAVGAELREQNAAQTFRGGYFFVTLTDGTSITYGSLDENLTYENYLILKGTLRQIVTSYQSTGTAVSPALPEPGIKNKHVPQASFIVQGRPPVLGTLLNYALSTGEAYDISGAGVAPALAQFAVTEPVAINITSPAITAFQVRITEHFFSNVTVRSLRADKNIEENMTVFTLEQIDPSDSQALRIRLDFDGPVSGFAEFMWELSVDVGSPTVTPER